MIIDLKKYLFIGVREDLDDFFARAQQKGFFEFIPPAGRRLLAHPSAIEKLIAALKILTKLPKTVQEERRLGFEGALRIAEEVANLKNHIEKMQEESRIIKAEIVRVAPLGHFSIEDLHFLKQEGKRVVQFFCVKSAKRPLLQDLPELIYLSTEYDLDYYMSISPKIIHPPHMIEMKVDLPVNDLKENLAILEEKLADAQVSLKQAAEWVRAIQEALIDELNDFRLNAAKDEASYPLDNSLFVIEAWVPENKVPGVFAMLQGLAVHAEPILIEKSDRMPTCMENHGIGKIGEDIVLVYDTPSATDKDPSRWVLWSFCIFFAMIINDACYGLLFLLLALLLKFKLPHAKAAAKRFFNLLTMLAICCMGWGVLTTSYFGLSILPDNPLSKVSIIDYLSAKKADYHLKQQDDVYKELVTEYPALATAKSGEEILKTPHEEAGKPITYPVLNDFHGRVMLELSLLVGVIHLGLSLLRYVGRNWAAIGWVIFMVGGYLYFPKVIEATSLVNYLGIASKPMAYAIGYQMIFIGIGLAVLLGLIQKRLKGLTEIMNVISIFADTLSYLRLYALALASTVMAETFNELGYEVGLAVGSLIILGGHSVNLLLGSMSGVIHGLRLNFLEWYHYSFEGGGRLFAPLHKIKKT